MKIPSLTPIAIVATVALGACTQELSGDVHDGPAGADAIAVEMHDNAFRPATLDLQARSRVTIEVRNEGDAPHTLTIDSVDLSTGTVSPGGVKTAVFVVPPGETEFRCAIHPDMTGKIVGS